MHFFNFAVSAESESLANPLYFVRQRYRPGDYVIFKLDIDNPDFEHPLVEQLLNDPAPIINEFYCEAQRDTAID